MNVPLEHEPFTYDGVKISELTSEIVNAMDPRRRMEILEALNSHIIAKGGNNVISPEEQRGALYLVRAQRVQGVRNNPRASKAAKESVSGPTPSIEDFE